MKYRKKPVVVEAKKWTDENTDEIIEWMGEDTWLVDEVDDGGKETGETVLLIPTLEGDMKGRKGDWIIKGVKNEFYPCRDDIFRETYEEVR